MSDPTRDPVVTIGTQRPGVQLEPTLALAMAMRATPGAYALLVGSGLSSAAGVPTGWGIVLDLLRQLAPAGTGDDEPSLLAWYREAYGEDPDYSRLLEAVAGTPGERRDRLRGYFEPTAEERVDGRKVPTAAHRAIARLARGGYVRVIVTPNFDHLLETALRDEGVVPAVISSADAVAGAMPLQHERVTIVKVHGDYTDVRIKNTPDELASYAPAMDRLLDRVFDEYGLVVCGWSAVWDPALRAAIERAPSRRFSSFWAQHGALAPEAARLAASRGAVVVPVAGADAFFEAVAERVASLEEIARPHPTSLAVAVASLKRYVPRPEERVRLHDLVVTEADALRDRAATLVPTAAPSADLLSAAVARLDASAETLCALLAAGVQWGEPRHHPLWRAALERAGALRQQDGPLYEIWRDLQRYPAQRAFYAAGVVAAGGDDADLAALLLDPTFGAVSGRRRIAAAALNVHELMNNQTARLVDTAYAQRKTAMSDHLFGVTRAVVRDALPDDETYADVFDRFELCVALVDGHESGGGRADAFYPLGRVAWRREHLDEHRDPIARLKREAERAGTEWFLLRRGLWGGDVTRALSAIDEMRKQADRRAW